MKEHYNKSFITRQSQEKIDRTIDRFTKSKSKVTAFLDFEASLLHTPFLKKTTREAVYSCGSWLEFRQYHKLDQTKLHNANFCKQDKLCPACAMRRASKQVQKVHEYLKSNPELLKKHWYYIVLPVQHASDEDFTTVYNRLRSGLDKLKKNLQNKRIGQKNKNSFFSQFEGVFYSIEITKTKNGWNIHANLMALTGSKIQGIYKKGKTYVHDDIMQEWAKFTGGSYIHSINQIDISTDELLIKNLLEIFKYSLKFQDLSHEDLKEVYIQTYKKRLLGGFGSLYGIKVDIDFKEDELHDEYLEIIYRYNYKTRNYFLHSHGFKLASAVAGANSEMKGNQDTSPPKKQLTKTPLPPRWYTIEIYCKDGHLLQTKKKNNLKAYSDYEIFERTMKLPALGCYPRRV